MLEPSSLPLLFISSFYSIRRQEWRRGEESISSHRQTDERFYLDVVEVIVDWTALEAAAAATPHAGRPVQVEFRALLRERTTLDHQECVQSLQNEPNTWSPHNNGTLF